MTGSKLDRHDLAQRRVEDWNRAQRVGAAVTVDRDNGQRLRTSTRSVAWVMCGQAVVQVIGVAGCYSLDKVSAA